VDVAIRSRVVELHAARIVAGLARGEIPTAEGSIAKLLLTDLLERIATLGVDLAGPYGALAGPDALADGQWAQAFLGYPGMRIAGGTDQIMRNVIGERVLGLPGEPRLDRDVPFREVPAGR
jgi:alkylation response protein AidB-like acyl-CoA dehydrogenase